jgi:hypothetical protein
MPSYDDHQSSPIDHDRIRRVLGLQLADRAAWDQPPRLHVISEDADGVYRLEEDPELTTLLAAASRVSGLQRLQLELCADSLYRYTRAHPGDALTGPGFRGIAHEYEAWSSGNGLGLFANPDRYTPEQLRREGERNMAQFARYQGRQEQNPDRVEVALIIAVMVDQTVHWGHWERGTHQPFLQYFAKGSTSGVFGEIQAQVRRLTRIFARHTGQ